MGEQDPVNGLYYGWPSCHACRQSVHFCGPEGKWFSPNFQHRIWLWLLALLQVAYRSGRRKGVE
jgi:hypothetical protein